MSLASPVVFKVTSVNSDLIFERGQCCTTVSNCKNLVPTVSSVVVVCEMYDHSILLYGNRTSVIQTDIDFAHLIIKCKNLLSNNTLINDTFILRYCIICRAHIIIRFI